MRGAGRVVSRPFLLIVGTLNIICGIGALADANFYANDTGYILTNLNTLGWVLIIVGVLQLTGASRSWRGTSTAGSSESSPATSARSRRCCRWATPPLVELAIFALCVWVVYGIIVFEPEEAEVGPSPRA